MDFAEFRQETVKKINKELEKLLSDWRKEVAVVSKDLLPLVDKFITGSKGGKGIRGSLVVLGYQLARHLLARHLPGEQRRHLESGIIKVAAAYEIFHTAILAHDDIVDQSPLRRDQPSLYQALGGDHQGISLAISLADAGFFLAERIIAETDFADQENFKALKYFAGIKLDTGLGQILDIAKGDSLTVAKYKTAQYTVSGPLVLGAILGKGSRELLGKLGELGENLGIAFQIQDDILDKEVDWLGGIDNAKKEAERYKNKAMKVIPQITKDKEMSKMLGQLADYLVKRNK